MTRYERGRKLEYHVRDHLERDGYHVIRSAGSYGIVDIAAFKPAQTLLIQVKRDGTLPVADWNELYDLAHRLGAVPILATGPGRAQLAFHRLAARRAPRSRTHPSEPFATDEVNP